jgi:2-polyprenyl-3-methyl-5-hydroxy-6-metoxy-1,4-benzoquinol methylase
MSFGFQAREFCPICDSRDRRQLTDIGFDEPRMAAFLQDFYAGRLPLQSLREESYRVFICRNCDFIYQDPILDEAGMQALYEHWIDAARSLRKKQAAGEGLRRRYAGQIRTLARMLPGAPAQRRILEFGMGWGYWSLAAQDQGFDVSGYELSRERREYARGLGVRVIDELPPPGEHFDCIFSSQVFEHLPEPRPTLESLCARLAPGGLVYLRVPDGRGVARTLSRRGWSPDLNAIHPLEHINCFTRRTLIGLGERLGLRQVQPPPRLALGSLLSGLKRELADRYLNTHLFFRYRG